MHLTEATTAVDSPKVAEQERQDLVHRLAEVTEQLKAAEAHKQGLELQLCDSISELDLMKCSNEEVPAALSLSCL